LLWERRLRLPMWRVFDFSAQPTTTRCVPILAQAAYR